MLIVPAGKDKLKALLQLGGGFCRFSGIGIRVCQSPREAALGVIPVQG